MKGVGLRYMSCPVTWLRFGHVMWHHISSSMGPGWWPWGCRTGSLQNRKPSRFLLGSSRVSIGCRSLGNGRVQRGRIGEVLAPAEPALSHHFLKPPFAPATLKSGCLMV